MRPSHTTPLRAIVRIGLLALTALAAFGVTAALCAVPVLWYKYDSLAGAGILALGVLCGLIAWLFIAVFHMRKEAITLTYDDRASFLLRLHGQLQELGYEAGVPHNGKTLFKPGFTAYLAGGAVQVVEHPGAVVITGPKVFVEMLRKRMKILHHLTSIQQNIQDSRVRQGRHLVRRVAIDLRVSADQWQTVYDNVLTVLANQDADIVCEVHILAHKESGILDYSIEAGIRENLREQNIPVEIRKETRPSSEQKLVAVTAS